MAQNVVEVIVKVRDAASGKLRGVEHGLKRTRKAVQQTGADFTKFNRIMFSTTAFIGIFERAFARMSMAVQEGANLDRLENSFERVLGPTGSFFRMLKGSTDSAVDRFAAMESAIKMRTTGVSSNMSEIAQSMAMATNAAKLMGKDSATGIKQFTDFVMSANVASLEQLGLIRRSDASYQMFNATLTKVGGHYGGVIAQQARLRLGMRLLRERTRDLMFGNRDLADVLLDITQSMRFAQASAGRFLGTALKPLLEKVIDLADAFTDTLDNIRKNDKDLMFLAKSVIYVTGTITALTAAIGVLRLTTLALGSVGVGIPMLTGAVAALAAGFMFITSSVDGFTEKLKVFAGFFRGTFQLVHSFLSDPENFAKGIGKMDESIAEMLRKNGLLNLALNVARVSSVIITFVRDVGRQLIDWAKTAYDFIDRLVVKFRDLMGFDGEPWSRKWIEGLNGIRGVAVKVAAAFVGFKVLQPLLRRLPIIGRLFGGGGPGGGRGDSPTNPMWVANVGAGLAGAAGGLFKRIPGVGKLTSALQNFILKIPFLANIFTHPGGILKGLGASLMGAIKGGGRLLVTALSTGGSLIVKGLMAAWPVLLNMLPVALAGAAGVAIGTVIEPYVTNLLDNYTQGKTSEGFEGNILERGFFKLDKFFGGDTSKMFIENQKKMQQMENMTEQERNAYWREKRRQLQLPNDKTDMLDPTSTASTPGTTAQASPTPPETAAERENQLADMIMNLEGGMQKQIRQAFFEAMAANSAGGKEITREEWVDIMAMGMDKSQNLNKMANKPEVTAPNVGRSSRD